MSFVPDSATEPPVPDTIGVIIKLVPGANYDAIPATGIRAATHEVLVGVRTFNAYRQSDALLAVQMDTLSVATTDDTAAVDEVVFPRLIFDRSAAVPVNSVIF